MTSIGRPLKSNRSTTTITSMSANSTREGWKNSTGNSVSISGSTNHLPQLENKPSGPTLGVGICRSSVMNNVDEVPNQTPKKAILRSSSQNNIVRDALYIGSFSVDEESQEARANFIRKELHDLKNISQAKEVKLMISLSGIKVCNSVDNDILMAHALKRISYATCNPERCQISILAREPKTSSNIQYCHTFHTRMPSEAEDINKVIANAFKMAYSAQKSSDNDGSQTYLGSKQFQPIASNPILPSTPALRNNNNFATLNIPESESQRKYKRETSFNDLIEEQLNNKKMEEEIALSRRMENLNEQLVQISTPNVFALAQERKDRRSRDDKSLINDDTTIWARKMVEEAGLYISKNSNNDFFNNTDISAPVVSLVTILRRLASANPNGNRVSPVSLIKSLVDTHFCDASVMTPPKIVPCTRSILERSNGINSSTENPQFFIDENNILNCQKDLENSNFEKGIHASLSQNDFTNLTKDILPKNFDSGIRSGMDESDAELSSATWYQPGVPREIALESLRLEEAGSFVVRNSSTHPGCYALSILTPRPDLPQNITHYLITKTSRGSFKIKGLTKEWASLSSLVHHHTLTKELLPCLLILPRNTATNENISCH